MALDIVKDDPVVEVADGHEETPVDDNEKADEKAEETDQKTDDEAEGDEDDKKSEKPEDHKPNRIQKRIDKLTRDKYELKGRLDMLERMMAQQNQDQPKATDKPARANYENDEEYVSALTDWMVTQKLSNVKNEISQHQVNSQMDVSWNQKVQTARESYPDYDEVMEDANDISIPQHLQASFNEALKSSDLGADIVYHLAKNPDEATRIFALPINAAIREIGKLESRLEVDKNAKTNPIVKKSKAPEPIKPPRSSGGSTKVSLDKMTPAEYVAYRNKQTQRR